MRCYQAVAGVTAGAARVAAGADVDGRQQVGRAAKVHLLVRRREVNGGYGGRDRQHLAAHQQAAAAAAAAAAARRTDRGRCD